MRTATFQNRTYRNAFGNCQARVVTGTDALRKQLAGAFFPARHVVRHRDACVVAHLREDKQAAAGRLAAISASMSGPQSLLRCEQPRSMRCSQPWAAERGPRAFVTSA
jgi:hypothetical protein